MELELKKESFDAYESGGEVTLTQEETTETIVPDYCPDVARIIETNGAVFLHSRELRGGRAEVTGSVRMTVVYAPEEEGGVRTLEYAIPFTVESDHRALADCSCLTAEVSTEFLETRMLNPRKLFSHCKLVSRLIGYRKAPVTYCRDAEAEPDCCLEKRQEQQHGVFLTHIGEKDFSFSQELPLNQSREGAAELLTSQVYGAVTETKVVGGKLLFQGAFTVRTLYRTESGRCCSCCGELPFSQVMDVEGAGEEAEATVQLQLTGCDVQLDGGDDGHLATVNLYCHATALLREERELTLLVDLYSTAYETTYEAETLPLTCYRETLERRQSAREVLEIGVVADAILALSVTCGPVSLCQEGKSVTLRTGAMVHVLYQDEGGSPLSAERCVDVSLQLELPENCRLSAHAFCPEEVQGTLVDQGIEVRFQVLFTVEAATHQKRVCIARAELDREHPHDGAGSPSLVLRCLGEQEQLWDLAKAYNTNIASILAANQLEGESGLPREKLLLIPRKRA